MPPRRPFSPQPKDGSWKLSEKLHCSTSHPVPSSTFRPVSHPLAFTFRSRTFETPLALIATPRKSDGDGPSFRAAGPSSQAPRPSIVTFDALITIALYVL